MKLLVQPGDGVAPLIKAINEAKTSIEVLIFRFDRVEIENALLKAVSRGVAVRSLIAHTNRGGERNLRALEMRLLAAGVAVSRTDDDLVRYHGKMMIIDRHDLYLMAFNFTNLDIERSRSFGVVTDDRKIVQEALDLFNADSKRVPYAPDTDALVISPVNARRLLADFIKGAEKELLIYDPAVTDPAMTRLLDERAKAGVEIRLLGRISRGNSIATVQDLFMRLHARTIVRDREEVFLGSQSLRTTELDARREVGLIFGEPEITARLVEIFEDDWKQSKKHAGVKSKASEDLPDTEAVRPLRRVAKKVAKTVVRQLPPVAPVLEVVVRELAGPETEVDINPKELQATVKTAVRNAIQEAVAVAVEQATKAD